MMSQRKTPRDFTASVRVFHLEGPLKFQFAAFEGSFQLKFPPEAVKSPFSVTSLTVHSACDQDSRTL